MTASCVVTNPADINLDSYVTVGDVLTILSVFGQYFD